MLHPGISAILILLVLILNLPLYRLLYRRVFRDSHGVEASVRAFLTPDIVSLFRGKYREDARSERLFSMFLLVCAGALVLEITIFRMVWIWLGGV